MIEGRFAQIAAVCLVALWGCANDINDGDGNGAGPDASVGVDTGVFSDARADTPDAGPPGTALGIFRLTYYWITDEADYAGSGVPDTDVYGPSCDVLTTVSRDFFDSMRLEGTARLLDMRVLNYWGRCDCPTSPCFAEVDAEHPWGSGSMNRPLIPFRSVAVDRDVLSIGQSLYVPELDGVLMPGESPWGDFVHDGCVAADDTGGGINGMHIDFFTALRGAYRLLDGALNLREVTLLEGGERCP